MSDIQQPQLSHTQLLALKKQSREAHREKYLEDSRQRLERIISTKMRTCFIGSLDTIEQRFGFLWGHSIPEEEKTEEQKEFAEIWQIARTEILNKGNNQLRALRNELKNNTIHWDRFQINFVSKEQDNGKK